MNLADLKKPFAPDRISWRVGSTTADKKKGMALAYIDARDVQDRLDEACGVDGWQCRYVPMHDKKTVCEIGVKIGDEWVWKADGAGDTDVEAEKGALSDAFKRAAVRWGVGRYLYDLDSPWVALEPAGRSFKIADGEHQRLQALLARDAKSSANTPARTLQPQTGSVAPATTSAEQKSPAPPKMTPKQWGDDALSMIRTLKGDDLDAYVNKNTLALVKLRAAEPDLHRDIMALIQQRQALYHPANAG